MLFSPNKGEEQATQSKKAVKQGHLCLVSSQKCDYHSHHGDIDELWTCVGWLITYVLRRGNAKKHLATQLVCCRDLQTESLRASWHRRVPVA